MKLKLKLIALIELKSQREREREKGRWAARKTNCGKTDVQQARQMDRELHIKKYRWRDQ